MKIIKAITLVLALLSLLVLVGSWPVRASYAGRAQLIQRVQQDKGDEVFGDAGANVGSPQLIIVDDPKAFVAGTTPEGAKMVSENYLNEHKIYPLQLKTVDLLVSYSRMASGISLVLFGLLYLVLKRKPKETPFCMPEQPHILQ